MERPRKQGFVVSKMFGARGTKILGGKMWQNLFPFHLLMTLQIFFGEDDFAVGRRACKKMIKILAEEKKLDFAFFTWKMLNILLVQEYHKWEVPLQTATNAIGKSLGIRRK